MTSTTIISLLPPLVLGFTALLVLLAIAFKRHHGLTVWLSIIGVAAAGGCIAPAAAIAPVQATPLAVVDSYTLFFWGVLLASAAES
jgi:NADH-quinone oxidoreductase subunit N